jgi:molybdopterin-dependent oxidoreductase alpha subunit
MRSDIEITDRGVAVEPPLEAVAPERGELPTAATGMTAVAKSLQVSLREMGAVRTAETWVKINQRSGFDCPSCAWADPLGNRETFEFCENGAKAAADDATRKTIGREFFAQYAVAELSRNTDQWLNAQGRIAEPMILREGGTHYEPIAWEDAFAVIGRELRALGSPNAAAFYTSGKASNEAAFLFQLFARRFGTNNLPDCSNMCHESSGAGLKETLGAGKSTVTLEDLENTDCIIVIGQNPGTNHPRMLTSLQKAKRRGAKIIAANPLKEVGLERFKNPQEPLRVFSAGTRIADLYLQVRINGDVALLKGLSKSLLEEEDRHPGSIVDRGFVSEYTDGFEEFSASIHATSWEEIVAGSCVSQTEIEAAGRILAERRTLVICWAMGLTQHLNAVDNIRELVNLLLIRGNVGKPNAGALCVRGHSNVQGDRTMGIWEKMGNDFLDALGKEFRFEPPRKHGVDTVETIEGMASGRIKAFISLGGNFLSATPDTHAVAKGLTQCNLTVGIGTKLNRSHLTAGKTALLLPCLGRTDIDRQESGVQTITVENTISWVSGSKGHLEPVSAHLRSEVAIVAGMAEATLGKGSNVDWTGMTADYDRIREAASRIVPGFERFSERIRAGGFFAPVAPKNRVFPTATGKARFSVTAIRTIPLEAGQFLMMTIRTHDQFNTVVYGLDDRYRGIYNGRRVVFMNPEDIAAQGLRDGQLVDITSHFEGRQRRVEQFRIVSYDIPRTCVATYFPESNPLVPVESRAEISQTPTSKSTVVSFTPSVGTGA